MDLFKAPHVLIGGATNSGKSNFMHSLVVSLMMQYSPQELRFILADPKRIDMPVYNDLPYLLTPVIMDYKKAINALKWCINELDRRFDVLSKAGVSDINKYNKKHDKPMPFIVFAVDEMSDFSVADKNGDLFEYMIRIFQMGRAVGIHLIVASARPCDETFPGVFRANIVSRLAFSTASSDDSKIILDDGGAEKLLGQGDALYTDADSPTALRVQVPFISDNEIGIVIESIRKQQKDFELVDYVPEPYSVEDDELYEEAKEIVATFGKASATLLQRKLRIGYARASMLIDMLEETEVIGPLNGATPREVYIETKNSPSKYEEDDGEDILYHEVEAFVIDEKKVSTAMLQRKFDIGYARAASLLDALEENDVIGPANGAKPREVY